jgi:RecA/RadA recombinase
MSDHKEAKIKSGELEVPLVKLELNGIKSRGITPETCGIYEIFGTSHPLEIGIPLYDYWTKELVGIKYRKGGWTKGKKEVYYSKGSKRSLFGVHLALEGEEYNVYLCEGETDAMRLSQWEGLEPYSLCLAYGGHPDKATQGWIEELRAIVGTCTLYTCFDNDASGYGYRDTLDAQWEGSISHINLPQDVKDVCELLESGREPQWGTYQLPENLLTGEELILDEETAKCDYLTTGYPYLDELIGGFSPGGMILIAGAPKNGKTSFVNQLVVNFLNNNHGKVLLAPLELSYQETVQSLAAISLGKLLTDCSKDELKEASKPLSKKLFVLRHFGYLSISELRKQLDVIPKLGIKLLVLDHITAAVTSFDSGLTTQLLDSMMSLIQAKVNEYGISVIIVSHVNKTDNDRITTKDLRGSNSLSQIPSSILGVTIIEDGVTRVHTLTVTRAIGRTGEVLFDFNGKYEEVPKKGRKAF